MTARHPANIIDIQTLALAGERIIGQPSTPFAARVTTARGPRLAAAETAAAADTVIAVDPARRFQTVRGFGFSLTGGSALLLSRMRPAARRALLEDLFAPAGAVGVSCLRLTVGASDLGPRAFSYRDDPARPFDLFAGDPEVVPILKEILGIAPGLLLIASPWSAPPWMKTNGGFVGGELKPEHHADYAEYLVAYLAAMRGHGIRIRALTVQNEPGNHKNDPSMVMSAAQQAEFVSRHLAPALAAAGLDVEIFCHDHNCDNPEYPLAVLAAAPEVAGSAFHLYAGEPEAMAAVHERFPDKAVIFTEQWVGRADDFGGALMWHAELVLVGALRNWAEIVLEWNLAADPDCKPHTPGGEPNCVGALTLDGDRVVRNVAYYLIAHAARFIPPGSVRIASTGEIPNVAFATPTGELVVLAVNPGETPRALALDLAGAVSPAVALPPRALATCIGGLPR